MNRLTVKEVAAHFGISTRRVIALIETGALPAEKFSRVYAIKESDLKLVANRKTGRPPNKATKKRAVKKRSR